MASVSLDPAAAPASSVKEQSPRRSRPETRARNELENESTARQTYTPLDMAEYIFSTGDERSVTSAIEDLLKKGSMSPEAAITFLQQMKLNLIYLQTQYAQEQRKHEQQLLKKQLQHQVHTKRNQQQEYIGGDLLDGILGNTISDGRSDVSTTQKEYDSLLGRCKVADMLYTEYSLEEVIYLLAKVMFRQSLAQEGSEGQSALHKFTKFLELEAKQGRISRQLERKVLDAILASLSDTLAEHPEILTSAKNSLAADDAGATPSIVALPRPPVALTSLASEATSQLLRQLLLLSPELVAAAKSSVPAIQQTAPRSVSRWSEYGLLKTSNNPPEQQEDAGVRELHALKMSNKSTAGSRISETSLRTG